VIPAPDGAEFVPSSLDDPSFAASPPSPPAAGSSAILPRDRPELAIGGAFAGGLVLALILKRLAR